MRFARLIAAAVVVVAVGAGGLFVFAPEVVGQGQPRGERGVRVFTGSEGDLDVFRLGGARIGVAVRDVDQADVTREKLGGLAGAVVEEVRSDSPAAKAGLKAGDVIVAFDAERVRSARQLERLVEETPAGRPVKMSLQRGGSKVDLEVTPEAPGNALGGERFRFHSDTPLAEVWPRVEGNLKRRFPAMEFNWDGAPELAFPGRARLGVQVQELTGQLAGYFGVKSGVLVSDVDEGSAAAKAGVKAGDVITAVNGQGVSDPGELREQMAKVEEGKAAEIAVTRGQKSLTLKVDIEPTARKVERRVRRSV